ncbi:YbaB/EbfC family nucleoid-associated protein [Actinophytocola sp. NPDC049390]|uniref:YbaB/EbfC family nucleoid-associated protein n=1 Tax=Actinophytocola sp. NPDC049390 TaxID=3363894 RepID=UPI0037A7F61A
MDERGIIAGYEQLAEDVRVLQRVIAETRETADSADGLVAATVDGHGRLVELWLDPRVYRTPDSVSLATTIADTVRAAVRQADERVFAAARKFLPENATAETADLTLDPFLHQLDRR